MKPLPWSPSALDTFVNCPRQYQAKYVLKNVKEERSEQQVWGEHVHKCFEERQSLGKPLPESLEMHEDYMVLLEGKPGMHYTELKIAFTKPPEIQPCSWDWRREDIWCRGVIDYLKVDVEDGMATIVDYKTGKPHTKYRQLSLYALHTFGNYPAVNLINAQFYWTQTGAATKKVWSREDIPGLWADMVGDLKQYKEAFKTDTWQARQSGLCNGWCPVKDCEHWKPRRQR